MSNDHNRTNNITLSPATRVPLYVLGSAIGLAVYGTCLFKSLASKMDNAVTEHQVQHWIDDAREKNPSINWPRLPAKTSEDAAQDLRLVIIARKDE